MSLRLLDLPDPALIKILSAVPSMPERVSLACSCRKLWRLSEDFPAVWASLCRNMILRTPSHALQFEAWLHSRRPHICKVVISTPGQLGDEALFLVGLLAGCEKLESLTWLPRGTEGVQLGCWLRFLPRLQHLAAPSCLLKSHLSCVTTLRSLNVYRGRPVTVEPGCFPASLEELSMEGAPANVVATLGTSPVAAHLRDLKLSGCRPALDCSELGSLMALTSLTLRDCSLTEVPAGMAALTALQRLELRMNKLGGGWGHLLHLAALSFLDLSWQDNNAQVLPPELLAMPQLQELQLHDCHSTRALPQLPTGRSSRLHTLTLEFEVGTRSVAALESLAGSLQQLVLQTSYVYSYPEEVLEATLADAAALLRLLTRCPGLRVTWDVVGFNSVHFQPGAAQQELLGLVRAICRRYEHLGGLEEAVLSA